MKTYTSEQVLDLLGSAFERAETQIFMELRGADNEQRLDRLDVLDAMDLAQRQVRVILDNEQFGGDDHE